MRRHIQELGIKKWYGGDYLDLQSEPLKVIDGFFNQFGSHIVSGCRITANGDRFDISPGLVALAGSDPQGAAIRIVAPFAGALSVALPAYLSLDTNTISRLYDDGVNKPVINDYTAVITNLPPAGDYITLASVKVLRFADVIQDSLHRFITDTERIVWNAKETTAGAQEKANAAVQSSKAYTDTREAATRSYADT